MYMSLSAQIDPDKYKWAIYGGSRAKVLKPNGSSVKQKRGHILKVAKGDLYGHLLLRNGRYRVVHEDHLHIIYNLSDRELDLMMKRSKSTRRKPKVKARVERTRTKPRKVREGRFKAGRRVTNEKNIIDRANYQWVKIQEPVDILKSPAGAIRKFKLPVNAIVGIRFEKPARGGVLVFDKTFNTYRIHTDTFDQIAASSETLVKQPRGTVRPTDKKDTGIEKHKPIRSKRVVSEAPVVSDEFLSILDQAEEKEKKKQERNKRQRTAKRVTGKPLPVEPEDPEIEAEEEQQHKDDTVERISGRQRRPRRLTQGEEQTDYGMFEKAKNLRLRYEAARRDKDVKTLGILKRQLRALAKKIEPETKSQKAAKVLADKLGIKVVFAKPPTTEPPVAKKEPELPEESLIDLDDGEDIGEEPDIELPEPVVKWNQEDFEPADVLVFHKDKAQREFIVLEAFPDPLNDRITKYIVYNITEEPEYIQTFSLTPLSKTQSLPSKARLARKAERTELAKYRKLLETLEVVRKSPYKE